MNGERTTVVGVFTNHLLAERALSDLHRANFTDEQIGFVVRAKEATSVGIAPTDPRAHVIGATTGAVSGVRQLREPGDDDERADQGVGRWA